MALTTPVFDGKGILENYMQSANNFMTAVHGFGQQKLAERTQDNYDRISDQNERKLQDELEANKENRTYGRFALSQSMLKANADVTGNLMTADRDFYNTKREMLTLAAKGSNMTPDEKIAFKTGVEKLKSYRDNPSGRENTTKYVQQGNAMYSALVKALGDSGMNTIGLTDVNVSQDQYKSLDFSGLENIFK